MFAMVAMMALPSCALRLQLQSLTRQATSNLLRGVAPSPSPFALAECGIAPAFTPTKAKLTTVTLVWDAAVESDVTALMKLALSGPLGAALTVTKIYSSSKIKLVVRGARQSCDAFVQHAAMRNLAVQ